ncbi:MAG: uracil-DNA glycosylase [Micavibrio aeruginosavorus]|uniref:Uracil-DNA glycosylase n=1 Tax=Micavibrio aeruginosavorus TaxID=349221 RepID=A0A2W5FMP8_9BACT|nr:MAG: uracil-DNA glycosylase [Micavibrio aeruginosavorus]
MKPSDTFKVEKTWLSKLEGEFRKPYMVDLRAFLQKEKEQGKIIFPKDEEIFNALNTTRFEDIRVVIIGQDPYHGENQAHGLSFSVRKGVAIPPSLKNIYKEIEREYAIKMPKHGDLTGWAEQGVLLLNATLTVEMAKAGSHQKKGWEQFTDAVIRAINDELEHVVFILWGAYAQKKGAIIDRTKHMVLEGPHPSPLSAHRGFLGCGHFKKANDYLKKNGKAGVDWTHLT